MTTTNPNPTTILIYLGKSPSQGGRKVFKNSFTPGGIAQLKKLRQLPNYKDLPVSHMEIDNLPVSPAAFDAFGLLSEKELGRMCRLVNLSPHSGHSEIETIVNTALERKLNNE